MEIRLPPIPLLLPLGALTAGIMAAVFSDINFWIIACGGAVAAIAAIIFHARGIGALLLVFATGAISGGLAKPPVPDFGTFAIHEYSFAGRVSEVKCVDVRQYLTIRVDSVGSSPVKPFRVRACLESAIPPVAPGDMVRFRSFLQSPEVAGSRLPSGMDMEAWCLRNRIAALAPEVHAKDFTITGYSPGLDTRMEQWRYRVADAILGCGLSPGCSELTVALMTGDRRFLDPALQEDFREAGLAHVLALSGTHIAIIAFIVSLILFPLRIAGMRHWQSALTIAMLWGFALFTGMAPSVVRAVTMASILMTARIIRRNAVPLNSLCAAALLILVFRPYDIFSVGFQLTFLAVAGILMFAWPASKIRRAWLRIPAQWVALSVSAVVATAPAAAWYFHTFPSNFLLSNVAMALLLPLFMAGGILSVISGGAVFFVKPTDFIFDLCTRMAHFLGEAGGGEIGGIVFTPWALLPYYLALVALWYALQKRRLAFAVNSVLLLAFATFLTRLPVYPAFEAYSTGNRYATVILAREGNSAYIFTDGQGGSVDLIKRTIPYTASDYLHTHRVDTLRMAYDGLETCQLQCHGQEWSIGQTRYAVTGRGTDIHSLRPEPDYMIITQGFVMPVEEATRKLKPKQVILSPRYNHRRRKAMADSLRTLGYNVIMRY